jgi:hypothetical protein
VSADHDARVAAMKRLAELEYAVQIELKLGSQGTARLARLLDVVREIFAVRPYESFTEELIVIAPESDPGSPASQNSQTISDIRDLGGQVHSSLIVSIQTDGSYRIWPAMSDAGPLGELDLSYRYSHPGDETVRLAEQIWKVQRSAWPCAFGAPTFDDLEDALRKYVVMMRRPVTCPHVSQSWRESERLGFDAKPEKHMRRSLTLALRHALRGAVVRPEQNQDETKPVDIEVSWWGKAVSAIIEIKWMGCSGPKGEDRFTTEYGDARARQGLVQIADYLDRRDDFDQETLVIGYLFVFDGRRRDVTPTQRTIDAANGLHYQFRDVEGYDAAILARSDIATPLRCFMEPVVTR